MNIKDLQKNWDKFGKKDPMWAILTNPEKKGNKWTEEEFFKRGRVEIQGTLNYIKRLRIPLTKHRALDFGCGIGRLSQALVKHFEEVHGVDIAPSMIEKANLLNAFPDHCHYHLNAVNNLENFPNNYFDLVYSTITLQHIKPNLSFNYIKEFLRVVHPEGIVIFQLPAEAAPKLKWIYRWFPTFLLNLFRRLKYDKDAVMEMYYVEKAEVLAFLEKNGGKLVHIYKEQNTADGMLSYKYFIKKQQS